MKSDAQDRAIESSQVEDNRPASRFEIRVGEEVAFLQYQLRESTIAYIHTEVPPRLEGHGIAARLAKHALDYARVNHLAVVPICPYVAGYIERHPEYSDLVGPEASWKEFLQSSPLGAPEG